MRIDGLECRSQAALVAQTLRRCPLCTKSGPASRLAEHLEKDHPDEDTGQTRYYCTIALRFKEPLQDLSAQTGIPIVRLLNAAVALHLERLASL